MFKVVNCLRGSDFCFWIFVSFCDLVYMVLNFE